MKPISYQSRWRKALKVLREIGAPGTCMCESYVNGTWQLTYPDGCPSCKAFSFLENLVYYEKKAQKK